MCGRFTLTIAEMRMVAEMLGVDPDSIPDYYRPRYNVAPTDDHFIVTMEYENRKAALAKWGLINRGEKDRTFAARRINARAESVELAPSFREAYRLRRCIIPADGFYEWSGPKTKRMPQWFHRADGGPLILFAGLYEAWTPEPGVSETTFTIITTTPNALIAPIHNRMPVVLSDRDADDWMNPRETDPRSLKRLLAPARDGLLAVRPASPLVNNVKNDAPELLGLTKSRI